MAVDDATVRRIGRLARIALADHEIPAVAQELSLILDFVDQLNEIDVDGVEPMTSVIPARMKMRADIVTDGEIAERVVANAATAEHFYFAVPKVID